MNLHVRCAVHFETFSPDAFWTESETCMLQHGKEISSALLCIVLRTHSFVGTGYTAEDRVQSYIEIQNSGDR